MLQVQPRKRITVPDAIRHTWTNIGYNTLPIDYLESCRDSGSVISSEWVAMLNMASIPQAGCILMEELEERIPSKSLAIETNTTLANGEDTDEEESNEESEANRFISKMTIEDKPGKGVWWKQLWKKITRATFVKAPRGEDIVKDMRISGRDLNLAGNQPKAHTTPPSVSNHVRRLTEIFRIQPESKRHYRSRVPRLFRRD